MKNKLKLFIFLLLFFGCDKEEGELKNPNLEDILMGEWLLTETLDRATNGDIFWHEYTFPELGVLILRQDSVIMGYNSFAEERGTYSVSNDTIFFSILWDFNWIVTDFNEKQFTASLGSNREGEIKRRYTKIK